jgi:hypothetical protein
MIFAICFAMLCSFIAALKTMQFSRHAHHYEVLTGISLSVALVLLGTGLPVFR